MHSGQRQKRHGQRVTLLGLLYLSAVLTNPDSGFFPFKTAEV